MLEAGTSLAIIVVLALIAEAVFEALKGVIKDGKFSFEFLGTIALGVLVALGSGVSLFAILDIPMIPFVGEVLTGILISRGSSVIHELIKKLQGTKEE